ncbi:MAG: hypothetical protein WAV38_37195 [Xanthobacteraceae bacterium]
MNEPESDANGHDGTPACPDKKLRRRRKRALSRAIRPRSAITSGRKLFDDGDPNSAWTRRFDDLLTAHISDISAGQGADVLSAAQLTSLRQATAIEAELERLQSMLSRGEKVDLKAFAQVASHLRRMWETLGIGRAAKQVNDMNSFLAKRKQKSIATVPPTITPEPEAIK